MTNYVPPTKDMNFLLSEVFDFNTQMAELQGFEDIDCDLAAGVLEENGKFCSEILEPLNQTGDAEGCKLVDGKVITPKGFSAAYSKYVEAGWPSLSGDVDFGGQGLPHVLQTLTDEMISSANLSFGLFPGLTRGAVEALSHHASDELKAIYLPKMISGEWSGAMALTESNAGTDLGLLTSKASPQPDNSFKITGTKIFISSGDQDFGGNIIHLVLARLPDAPAGVKGISLFLVPKYLVNEDGTLGELNNFSVGSLEHKMGIHAQPTCTMNYDGATGWLIGEANRGLNAMFTMMNTERLFVGIQGLGVGEAAGQKAIFYANDRLQGKANDGSGKQPVAIINHPDVRKMLLTIRAYTEAGRALAVWTALQMERASSHQDSQEKLKANGHVSLLTPVIKAALSDFGFESAVLAQQAFGGHGYIKEWGMEQFVRDARITQIYEGTNGVQALDLAGRKLSIENGLLPNNFFALIRDDLNVNVESDLVAKLVSDTLSALTKLENTTKLLQKFDGDVVEMGAASTEYLRFFALVSYAWMMSKMAIVASKNNNEASPFYSEKIATANFFISRLLPQILGLEASISAGASSIMNANIGENS